MVLELELSEDPRLNINMNCVFCYCPFNKTKLFLSQCEPIVGHGFVLDKYKCQCKRGFYHPSRAAHNGFSSKNKPEVVRLWIYYVTSFQGEL